MWIIPWSGSDSSGLNEQKRSSSSQKNHECPPLPLFTAMVCTHTLQPHPVPAHHKERWLRSYYPRRRNREAFVPLHTCACSSHKHWPLMIVPLHLGTRNNSVNSITSWIWTPGSSSDRRCVVAKWWQIIFLRESPDRYSVNRVQIDACGNTVNTSP